MFVPDWVNYGEIAVMREGIEKRLSQLLLVRWRRLSGPEPLQHVQDDISTVETALGDLERWERALKEREEAREAEASAARREASIPAVPYVLPGEAGRGMLVGEVDEIIVGMDDVTIGQLRDALWGMKLRGETDADTVHISMPTTAWSVISSFLRGAE